jgi:transcriptional regulator with XRE-family HTH domain
MTLAMKIKRLRKAKGLTQETLAQRAKLSVGYVARVEIGRHEPTLLTLKKLAMALGVPLADLLPETSVFWRAEPERDAKPGLPGGMMHRSREAAERDARKLGFPIVAQYRGGAGDWIRRSFPVSG